MRGGTIHRIANGQDGGQRKKTTFLSDREIEQMRSGLAGIFVGFLFGLAVAFRLVNSGYYDPRDAHHPVPAGYEEKR